LIKKFRKVWKKVWKKFGNFGKSSEISETGFSECSEISEFWKFGNSELSKNYKKLVPT